MSKAKVEAPAHDFQDDVIAAHLRGVSGYTPDGREIPSSKPIEVPVEFSAPLPLAEEIRRLVRDENFRQELANAGVETFDEAEDFDVPDDLPDPTTPYEDDFEPGAPGVAAREQELRSGIVRDRDPKEKEEARVRLEEFKRQRAGGDASRSAGAVGGGEVRAGAVGDGNSRAPGGDSGARA